MRRGIRSRQGTAINIRSVAATWLLLASVTAPAQTRQVTVDTKFGRAVVAPYPQRIAFGPSRSLFAGDIDGDHDLDLIDVDRWWKNIDGTGQHWESHTIDNQTFVIDFSACADFDLDGDLDLVTGSDFFDDGMGLWRNADGAGTAWTRQAIDLAVAGNGQVVAGDVDGDTVTRWIRVGSGGSRPGPGHGHHRLHQRRDRGMVGES